MIHEIGVELQAALRAKNCPIVVVDREPTGTATYGRERIVIEHVPGGDAFGAARSQRPNPKHYYTRRIGAKVTIYAQSVKAGALEWEHRRRAEHILDLVLVGLRNVAMARKNEFTPTSGGFFEPPDLEASEQRKGAAYVLTFTFDRGVYVQTWTGDARPEVTVGEGFITSTTNVSINGADDDSPEVGCGA